MALSLETRKRLAWGESDIYGNPTSPEILMRLAKDRSSIVRELVAENPETPPPALRILAKDKSDVVRYKVAKNGSTPQEVIVDLINDPDPDVRAQAFLSLKNDDLFQLFAIDPCYKVRETVIDNSGIWDRIFPNTLKILEVDESYHVRYIVKHYIKQRRGV